MSTTICAASTRVPAARLAPLHRRAWHGLRAAWGAWRQRAHERAALRALEGLGAGTLHDIGLAERVPQRPALSLADYERGRW